MIPSLRKTIGSTVLVMVAFVVAKAISLAQVVIIADVFGVGAEWDAYVTANRVPELIFTLIAGGALATAFLPVFTGYLVRGDRDEAWRVASAVVNTVFLVTLAISAVSFALAPWVVANIVAPGFGPEQQAQTVSLMRILLLSTLIFSVSGIMMSILHAHQHFLSPSLAPIMFDVGLLLGIIVLIRPFGVEGVAYGAVLGAALHFLVQLPAMIHFKARWVPFLGWRHPALHQVVRLMLPRVAGLGVVSLNFVIANNFASRLGEGAVSAFDWGWRLMQIPETVIGTAIGMVVFPTLSAFSEMRDVDGKRGAMSGALRAILTLTMPSAVLLIVLGRPMIGLLERGAFDAEASAFVYSTLQFFALGLIVHSALEVVARAFYADKDTVTPLIVAFVAMSANAILSFLLSGVELEIGGATLRGPLSLGAGGLALANSVGVAIETGALLAILRRRWHGVDMPGLLRAISRAAIASAVMALAILAMGLAADRLGLTADLGLVYAVVRLGILGIVGLAVYLSVGVAIGLDEIKSFAGAVLSRRAAES